ncbi:hypothetical protein COY27_00585 [Candidatus Woesearchaeota archaeon CG_4_10_14_0_2_um_filter_33_13]|nr:MAG: hypothetical protein COY27_00585 [Candidatus Woesearchaeota archaeon CG_4_10_14_0_2_um_filter_33_13]
MVEGTYYWNCLAYNNQSESNWASSNRTVIVDVTYPIVELSTPTVDSGSVVNQNYILANVTVTETNFVNLSYYVYTPVGILYQNYTLTALPYNWTFTSLNDGTYYYNATICDLAGNCNSSSTYNITLDTTSPAIDYQTPATTTGNYSQDYIEANITASDSNLGTIILYLYNSTGLVQSNTSVSSPLFINFTSLDDGTYYVNATVNDTVGLTNYTSTRTIILDTTEPDVTALLPIADSTYRVNNLIQLGANITDTTLSVDTVKANITYPNGTSNLITLSQVGATSQYNNSFTIPYLNGSYNVTIIANDTVNNINSTENTYFNAEIHGINITQPNNQTTNNITSVNYTFTITNNGTGVDSYTITKTDTSGVGTLNQSTITNLAAGSSVQLILTVNSTIVGNYTVTVNVTSSNYTDVFALSSVTTEVLSGPLITSTSIVPYALINGSNVDLYVSAINNQSVWAVITLPNSTETVMDLNNNVNTSFSITELMGRHNVTFWVNDSYGATDNSTDYFETFEPITFNVTIIDFNDSAVNTTLRTDYRNTLLNTTNTTTGNFSEVWPNTLLDLQFNSYLNRLRVTFTGFNLSQNNGLSLGLDKLSTALSGYLGTYGINSSYNFTNATLRLYYDDLSYTNEGYLGLYTCNDWLFANQTCNGTWVDITSNATQSTSSDYFEYNTTSFSGFSIKQETVPSVPSGSSGSSGGGGGGGGGAAGLTYLISGEQFNAGYQKELSIGDRFKFNVGKETHYLTLNQTYENRIVVIVESQPHTATIYFNKTKYFELTGDQVYDLSVKVEDINHIGSKATLTMKSVAVPISSIPDEEIEPVTVLEPISEEILAPLELEEENLSVKKSEFSKILILILIVVVVLIVLFFLGHYFYKHPPKTSWPHISRPRFNLFRSKKKSVSERNKSVINTENKTSRKSNVKKNKEEKQDIKPMFANLFKLNLKDYLRRLRYLPKTIKKVERDAHKFIFHGFSFQEAFDKALSGKKISEDKIRPILEKLKITTKIAQKYHFDERKGKQFIDFVKSELRRHESIETIAKELVEGGMSQADALEFVNVYNKHQ